MSLTRPLTPSGEYFTATYRLSGPAQDAEARARAIAVEQTIEFPAELVRDPDIRDRIIGRLVDIRSPGAQRVSSHPSRSGSPSPDRLGAKQRSANPIGTTPPEKTRLAPEDIEPEALAPGHLAPEHLAPEHLAPEHLDPEHLKPEQRECEQPGLEQVEVVIEYAIETAGSELTQLLNVLFGNVSIQPGVRLVDIQLPPALAAIHPGPRFGRAGLRALLDVPERPLLCTALKPMGLSPAALGELAYQLALGGIDLIKDDHGLADQPFCPFAERVAACAEAVARANRDSGGRAIYLPNVTAPAGLIQERARQAKSAGAGGLLFAPGLGGFDALRALSRDDSLGLPILAHPAMLGSFTAHPDHGLSHRVIYGQLMRLAGADASIFPSFGGRFAFSQADCRDLLSGTGDPFAGLEPIFPAPGGGMRRDRLDELLGFYGRDCILLIGGDLHQGEDLVANCRQFRALVEEHRATAG